MRQNGDTKNVLYWQPKNIRSSCTNFRLSGDVAPRNLRFRASPTTTITTTTTTTTTTPTITTTTTTTTKSEPNI